MVFRADDCLLTPGERIVNYVFVGKIAAKERLFHLSRPNRFKSVRRREQCSTEFVSRSVKQDGFTFPLFRKKDLVNDVAGRVGNTRLDLNLKRLFLAAADLHPNADEMEPLSFARSLAGQLRAGVGGGREAAPARQRNMAAAQAHEAASRRCARSKKAGRHSAANCHHPRNEDS